tara:strand:+ start:4020 stop:4289 length:270 start_codon:yes stop_codon:yes gene_type:complete
MMYGMKDKTMSPMSESSEEMISRRKQQQSEMDERMEEFLRQDPRSAKPIVMELSKRFKLTPPQMAALSIFGEPSQAPNLMKTGPGMRRG